MGFHSDYKIYGIRKNYQVLRNVSLYQNKIILKSLYLIYLI